MNTLQKLCITGAFVFSSVVILHASSNTPSTVPATVNVTVAAKFVTGMTPDITVHNLQWYSKVMPKIKKAPLPAVLKTWDTREHDSTATWPDATDPMWKQPMHVQVLFACVRYHESRNHEHEPEPGDLSGGGWYQFTSYIWSYARESIPGLPIKAFSATGDQQSLVALWYYHRNGSLYPEWSLDMPFCK